MILRILLARAAVSAALASACGAQTVIVNEAGSGTAEHGAAALRAATVKQGLGRVRLAVAPGIKPEAFRISKSAGGYEILGGDARGVLYGALDAAEQIQLSGVLRDKQAQPSLGIRGLKFNIPLPGTGYLSEEDLANNQWFWSLDYWARFLDMAARNRYNTITFWSAHPYGRMVRIGKYPEAVEIGAAELDRNIAFFRKLFQMAADRGLDTYLVTWNIHVSRTFAEKRGIAASGFDSPEVRDYQREAIKALFATYPMLTGLGTTIGERMPNLTTQQKLDWVADTYFTALRQVGRPVPFILRYWQSEPEPMAAMLEKVKYPGPVYLDIKYNGEHMYSSVKPHVRDAKWVELARKGRWQLLWHLRNDCLFILRWGDPDFVRETVRNMMGPETAGFVEGSELDVPGTDRIHTAEAKTHLDWEYKFEKHWFRYMLWGRLGFDANEPDSTWQAHFRHRFGAAGDDVFEAMRQAGKIIPQITSYHWNYMNGDWYPEGSIGSWNTSFEQPRQNYRRAAMYHDIRTYIFNNTIDPTLANIPEFVAGTSKSPGPLEVAGRLEEFGRKALEAISRARGKVDRGQKEFICTDLDLQAYGHLGLYYADKLKGAAHLARFLFSGDPDQRQTAVADLRRAAASWHEVVAATENHYVQHEVWLFGQFHWKLYSADVNRDVTLAEQAVPLPKASTYSVDGLHDWLEYSFGLLGRKAAAAPSAAVAPLRFEAEAAEHLTSRVGIAQDSAASGGKYIVVAPAAEKAVGNAITGARDFVTAGNSAAYRIEIPADGTYQLWAVCWWTARSDNFGVFFDESSTRSHVLRPAADTPLQSWTLEKLEPVLYLGKGAHTLRFFGRSAGARIDRFVIAPPMSSPASVPEWARTGRFRAARWDGGPIEAEKGRLSDWPHYTDADQRGVMQATRAWYEPRTVEFLKTAHFNWAWVTWSVGFSHETERPQWEQLRDYIAACHRSGIRVAAYLSIGNMFWKDMFDHVPESKEWVEKLADGSPRFYKPPNRYMARIDSQPWREYVRARVQSALAAGADSFWIDNTFAYHGAANVQRFLDLVYGEAMAAGRPVVVMSNYNRQIFTWARMQNGVTTEDGREPGYWPGESVPLVTNAGLLRYHRGVSQGWRPVSVEYGGRHAGERFTTPMQPRQWQLSLAECAAFQASLEPFFEGLFLRDLHAGEPAALEGLKAIGGYNRFFAEHEAWYRDTLPAARVAIAAETDDRIVAGLNALAARNVQFEVLFPGDDAGAYARVVPARDIGTLTAPSEGDPISVDAPEGVLYNVLRQEQPKRLFLHLLNYSHQPRKGIRVRVTQPVRSVTLASPDCAGDRKLEVADGAFEIPELQTYSVVAIGLR